MFKVILALAALSSTLFVNLLAISEVTWGLIISGITTVLTGLIGLFAAKINKKVNTVDTKIEKVATEIDGKMTEQKVLIKSLAKAEQKIESDAEHKIEVKEIVRDAKTQSDLKDARAEIPPTKQAAESTGKEQLGATDNPKPVVIQTANLTIDKADITHGGKEEPPTDEKKE